MCFIKFTFYFQWDLLSITFMVLLHRQLGTSAAFYCLLLHKTSISSKFLTFLPFQKRGCGRLLYKREMRIVWGIFRLHFIIWVPTPISSTWKNSPAWKMGSWISNSTHSQVPETAQLMQSYRREPRKARNFFFFFLVYATRMLNFVYTTIW